MNTSSYSKPSDAQKKILIKIANASLTSKVIIDRAKIILLCTEGMSVSNICAELGISHHPVYKWRKRWPEIKIKLDQIEKEKKKNELEKAIKSALSDAPRSGAPPQFKEEQVMQIIALACTSPQEEGLPVSHWSCRLLADHAQELGIVESISFKQVNNFLKSRGVKTS
jgi:putative transposase